MVKPVDMDEMVLRVGALLRRARVQQENHLEIGDLVLVRDEMAAYVRGEEVKISYCPIPKRFSPAANCWTITGA